MMSNMARATVREVQHRLARVLARVSAGEEVLVTKRGKVVARIVRADGHGKRPAWPDAWARMQRLPRGGRARGIPISDLLSKLRGERP